MAPRRNLTRLKPLGRPPQSVLAASSSTSSHPPMNNAPRHDIPYNFVKAVLNLKESFERMRPNLLAGLLGPPRLGDLCCQF